VVTAASIKRQAREAGFDLCGIAPADAFPELRFFREWLARGYAGSMGYLARTAASREDVRRILPSARSVIVTGTVYNVDRPGSLESRDSGEALISRYAWGDDYHDVISTRLGALVAWMREHADGAFDAITCVDSGPVQERAYARRAGLGWVGKNTCLINPEAGSWLFLGEIVCSLALEPDAPGLDQCGSCTLCLEACPTGALVEPGVLDATRCLSYLTIELRDAIPDRLREPIGAHVFGCDICQEVCPWNQAAARSQDAHWMPRDGLDRPRLADLWRRTDEDIARLVKGSAMTRPKLAGLRRNVAVAIGNSRDADAHRALAEDRAGAASPSLAGTVVQEHVRWARARDRPA
jgi:epoxyqueuosine reductase